MCYFLGDGRNSYASYIGETIYYDLHVYIILYMSCNNMYKFVLAIICTAPVATVAVSFN